MAWPYSQIKTAVTGDILTATDYNNEHQNHITNNDPTAINDDSATVTAMKATTDPGESGTESLATTLDGEIQRLRFAIVDLKGTTFWYQTPTNTLAQMLPLSGGTLTGALTINPATNQLVLGGTASGRTVTITAPQPATSSRTWTIPDIAGNGTVAALEGAQTFSGAKTFSAALTMSGAAIAMGSQKVTGLANGTAATDAAAYGQLIYITSPVQTIATTDFATTSNTYATSNLSASITPSSASNRIKITLSGVLTVSAATGVSGFLSLFRGSTNLATGGNLSFARVRSAAAQQTVITISVTFIDSPATTSATTYAVKIKNSDNVTTVEFGQSDDQVMILEEIHA